LVDDINLAGFCQLGILPSFWKIRMNTIKIFLITSNGLAALLATLIFFFRYKIGFWDWLMINTCTPSVIAFIYGVLASNKMVIGFSSVLMFFYAILGLFILSWQGKRILPQMGHLLMIVAASYILLEIIKGGYSISFMIGIVLGIAIIIPLSVYQIRYLRIHPELIEKLKDPKFKKVILGNERL